MSLVRNFPSTLDCGVGFRGLGLGISGLDLSSTLSWGLRFTWTPKVGRIIAQNPSNIVQKAMILHTFGLQAGLMFRYLPSALDRVLGFRGFGVSGVGFFKDLPTTFAAEKGLKQKQKPK